MKISTQLALLHVALKAGSGVLVSVYKIIGSLFFAVKVCPLY